MKIFKGIEQRIKEWYQPLMVPLVNRVLHAAAANLVGVEDTVEFAFRRHYGIRFMPTQVRSEITQFLGRLSQRPPATVLEIGTYKGGTFFLFTRVATADALMVSLDLPCGQNDGYPAWRERLYRGFARDQQRLEVVRDNSHDPRTMKKIRQLLDGRPLELLFIDGDHSYQGVKADFELYSPLVSPEGVIAFHDIVPGPSSGGVPQFWQELKQTRLATEFVADWKQGGFGIGMIQNDARTARPR
jgi:predicted O-methyltransferase YrrM